MSSQYTEEATQMDYPLHYQLDWFNNPSYNVPIYTNSSPSVGDNHEAVGSTHDDNDSVNGAIGQPVHHDQANESTANNAVQPLAWPPYDDDFRAEDYTYDVPHYTTKDAIRKVLDRDADANEDDEEEFDGLSNGPQQKIPRRPKNCFICYRKVTAAEWSNHKNIDGEVMKGNPPAGAVSKLIAHSWDVLKKTQPKTYQLFVDVASDLKEEFARAYPGYTYHPGARAAEKANKTEEKMAKQAQQREQAIQAKEDERKRKEEAKEAEREAKKLARKPRRGTTRKTRVPVPEALPTPDVIEYDTAPTFNYHIASGAPPFPTSIDYSAQQFEPANPLQFAPYAPGFPAQMPAPATPGLGLDLHNAAEDVHWAHPMTTANYVDQQPGYYPQGYPHHETNTNHGWYQAPAQYPVFQGLASYPASAPPPAAPAAAPFASITPVPARVIHSLPHRARQTVESSPVVFDNSPALTNNAYSPASTMEAVNTPSRTKFARTICNAEAGPSTRAVVSDVHSAGKPSLYATVRRPPVEPKNPEILNSLLADIFDPELIVCVGQKRRASSQGGRSRVPSIGFAPPCVSQENLLPQALAAESAELVMGKLCACHPVHPTFDEAWVEFDNEGFTRNVSFLGMDVPDSRYDDFNF